MSYISSPLGLGGAVQSFNEWRTLTCAVIVEDYAQKDSSISSRNSDELCIDYFIHGVIWMK